MILEKITVHTKKKQIIKDSICGIENNNNCREDNYKRKSRLVDSKRALRSFPFLRETKEGRFAHQTTVLLFSTDRATMYL